MSDTPTRDEVLGDLASLLDAFEGAHERDPHASAAYLVLLRLIAECVASRAIECAAGVTFEGDTHTRAAVEWAVVAQAVAALSPCLACGGTRRAVGRVVVPDDERAIPCPACGGA
jgi:hypothetical protein